MTIDEAIEIYERRANTHERDAEHHRPLGHAHESFANVAEKRAREERQIAEWLKELKAYRETYPYGVDHYNGKDEPQTEETEMERLERIDNEIEDAWARVRELTDESQMERNEE